MSEEQSKSTTKTKSVRIPNELLEAIDRQLKDGESRQHVIETAIAAYISGQCSELSNEPKVWFQTSKKHDEIKAGLGIEGPDIIMTESELLQKASELSGISTEEITRQGREYMAQSLITQGLTLQAGVNKSGHTKGIAGVMDSKLDEAYELLKQEVAEGIYKPINGRIGLTKIQQKAGAGYPTAKRWAKLRGHTELL